MFRYSTYHKLGLRNLTIVGRCGRVFKLSTASFAEVHFYFIRHITFGFSLESFSFSNGHIKVHLLGDFDKLVLVLIVFNRD